MTTPEPKKPLNLSLRKRDEVTTETRNDSLILEILDQPFPDLRKLAYTVLGLYGGADVPVWLIIHLDRPIARPVIRQITSALLEVQRILRHSPRHPRPDQQFLRVPIYRAYEPRHLAPLSS